MEFRLGFDSYTNRARLAPALLVALPAGLAFIAWYPNASFESVIGSGLLTLALGMLFSNLVRDAGRKAEKGLLKLWGGFPTVNLLRHRNAAVNAVTRDRYHAKLSQLMTGTSMPTASTESLDPTAADAVYESCIRMLRAKTRDSKKFPLVFEETVGYGFRRNLWAMKGAGTLLCLLGLSICGYRVVRAYASSGQVPALPLVAAIIIVLLLAIWLTRINAGWVRDAADTYAEQLLSACDTL
jgi:hypothetical protein